MQDFTKLVSWKRAHGLALAVIRALPAKRCYSIPGIRNQAINAAISVPANLAEGCGRRSRLELARFTDIACGSLSELECHLDLANQVGILPTSEHTALASETREVRRMLVKLAQTVRRRTDS